MNGFRLVIYFAPVCRYIVTYCTADHMSNECYVGCLRGGNIETYPSWAKQDTYIILGLLIEFPVKPFSCV